MKFAEILPWLRLNYSSHHRRHPLIGDDIEMNRAEGFTFKNGGMMARELNDESGLSKRDAEARWQKHVIVTIWVLLGLFFVVAAGLFYGEAHGLFETPTSSPSSLWPDSLP